MNEAQLQRLRLWKEKADHVTNDHWVRFVIYWMIFDAYMTLSGGQDTDSGRLDWFRDNKNEVKAIMQEYWAKPEYQTALAELRKLSPVYDMRPSHLGESVPLEDISDANQIIRFIYQIRCNTFHGAKDLSEKRDQHLVRLAQSVMNVPLNRYLGIE